MFSHRLFIIYEHILFYYFIPMAKRNRESPLKCLQDLVNVIKQDQITRALYLPNLHRAVKTDTIIA